MVALAKILARMRDAPANVRFADLRKVCEAYFGPLRQKGSSHMIFKTPWPGDPRVNVQNDGGKAKAYQVRQVLLAIDKLGTKMTAKHYTYRITWSPEDNEHVGLCVEFPSLSWLAATPEEALSGIRRIVAKTIADLKKNGEPVPEALAERNYSGAFKVRVPPDLHRMLVLQAAEQGVSLNRLASAKLAN